MPEALNILCAAKELFNVFNTPEWCVQWHKIHFNYEPEKGERQKVSARYTLLRARITIRLIVPFSFYCCCC